MKKTLLLCFIHGFKGGDDTFANFPSHLKAILQHALPKVNVLAITYPKFETRGDLIECVGRFKEWLQNKVIDLEVANSTPSPTVDPSVHTILVGHSMGGIVAAETLLSIINEQPISSPHNSQSRSASSLREPGLLMFPYIQGILAFDTPYLGIAPGVVAHGAERHWNTANSAYSAYSNIASAFGWGGGKSPGGSTVDARKMLTAAPETTAKAAKAAKAVHDANSDAAAAPLWQKYGRVALFAGAAGALAAGGAAAYVKREQISEGFSWATSHLEFVGSLARPEDMQKRLNNIAKLASPPAQTIGFANIYTTLGLAVDTKDKGSWTGKVLGSDRTFCNLPKGENRKFFFAATNDKVTAETMAHMSMFEPRNNPGYYVMSERAKEFVIEWVEGREWYIESEGPMKGTGIGIDEDGEMVDVVDLTQSDEEEMEEVEEIEQEEFENVIGEDGMREEYENVGRPGSMEWKDELKDEL